MCVTFGDGGPPLTKTPDQACGLTNSPLWSPKAAGYQ